MCSLFEGGKSREGKVGGVGGKGLGMVTSRIVMS